MLHTEAMIEGRRLDNIEKRETRRAPPTAKAAVSRKGKGRPPLSYEALHPPAPPPVPPELLSEPVASDEPASEPVAPDTTVKTEVRAKSGTRRAKDGTIRSRSAAAPVNEPASSSTARNREASPDKPRTRTRQEELAEQGPMTEEEFDKMQVIFRELVRKNLFENDRMFPNYISDEHESPLIWSATIIEQERTAHRKAAISQQGWHITTENEMDTHKSSREIDASPALVNLVLDLLRMKRARIDPVDVVYNLPHDSKGWIKCDDLIAVVRDAIPGSQFNHPRLVSLVRQDKFRRMLLRTSEQNPARNRIIDDLTHIKANSGHDPEVFMIDPKDMFEPRQTLGLDRNGYYRPADHSGPRYAYYYTDLAGLMEVWRNNGISPNCVRYGVRSKIFVYLCPTVTRNGDCPEACKAHIDKNNIQIVVDLGMMLFDQFNCYYTDDGWIAARADFIPAAYWCQITCVNTGYYYFIRPFRLTAGHWTQVLTRPAEPKDTRSVRGLLQEPCYICGTEMWLGMVNCFQCGSPIIYEKDVVPNYRADFTGLPAINTAAHDDDTLFKFRIRVAEGRKARGFQFNIKYRVRLPSTKVLTSSWTTGRRSYVRQGERWGNHLIVAHRKKVESGFYPDNTIEHAIDNDPVWRMELANRVVRCNLDFSPAQILKSRLCRYAFEKAIELGELSRENIGKRVRTAITANEDDDE